MSPTQASPRSVRRVILLLVLVSAAAGGIWLVQLSEREGKPTWEDVQVHTDEGAALEPETPPVRAKTPLRGDYSLSGNERDKLAWRSYEPVVRDLLAAAELTFPP